MEWPLASDAQAPAIAVDDRGDTWIPDVAGHSVLRLDRYGELRERIGGWGSEIGRFDTPWGIAIGGDGRIYVGDRGNTRVQILSREGAPEGVIEGVNAVAIVGGPDGSLYMADYEGSAVRRFAVDGTELPLFKDSQGAPTFDAPDGVAMDGAGNLYVLETSHNRIRKFTADGREVGQWGSGEINPDRERHAKQERRAEIADRYRQV
jgi:streptogramin lyase